VLAGLTLDLTGLVVTLLDGGGEVACVRSVIGASAINGGA
jgi:hypothetical protein